MERWHNKIAVITGASAGIGAAIAKSLAEEGMIVVGLARRVPKMETQTRPMIAEEYQKNFHTFKCDVCDEQSVKEAFAWIVQKFGGIDVLINNAGIVKLTSIVGEEDNSDILKDTINTNIMGIVWCTREAYRSMHQRNVDGHILIINSLAGHVLTALRDFSLNIYGPSKHAVTAMTEILRQEFIRNKTKIKVTSISPSTTDTEIMGEGFTVPKVIPMLHSVDIANAVVYCIQTPPHVQVHEMIIRPVGSKL